MSWTTWDGSCGGRRQATQIGWDDAEQQIALSDGGAGLEDYFRKNFPLVVPILDFWHVKEYLVELGQALFGAGSDAGKAWLDQRCPFLRAVESRVFTMTYRLTAQLPICHDPMPGRAMPHPLLSNHRPHFIRLGRKSAAARPPRAIREGGRLSDGGVRSPPTGVFDPKREKHSSVVGTKQTVEAHNEPKDQ